MTSPRPGEPRRTSAVWIAWMLAAVATTGCQAFMMPIDERPITPPGPSGESKVPYEMSKVTLPTYRIAPPDVIEVEAVKIVPKSPYHIDAFDVLRISTPRDALPDAPINNVFSVDQEGKIDLGPVYGKISVIGLTIEEAKRTIETHLQRIGREAEISVGLYQYSGGQEITGSLLVQQDGTINLGKYGVIPVVGLTEVEAAKAIEKRLEKFLQNPEVSVSVFQYNSLAYYVITSGAGLGDNVRRFQNTGNETVLDAVANIGGISASSSKKLWVVRPTPGGEHADQILPVDWDAVVQRGDAATNYQLLPGDRLFISDDPLVKVANNIERMLQPIERLFAFANLGTNTLNSIKRFGLLR